MKKPRKNTRLRRHTSHLYFTIRSLQARHFTSLGLDFTICEIGLSRSPPLKRWPEDQQHQHHLEAWQKCSLRPCPDLLNQTVHFNPISRRFTLTQSEKS